MGTKDYGSPHKHHHPNGSRWGNQWCRCQMDTHAHCAHRSSQIFSKWCADRPDQGVGPPTVLRTTVGSVAHSWFFMIFHVAELCFWGPARQKNQWGLSYITGCRKSVKNKLQLHYGLIWGTCSYEGHAWKLKSGKWLFFGNNPMNQFWEWTLSVLLGDRDQTCAAWCEWTIKLNALVTMNILLLKWYQTHMFASCVLIVRLTRCAGWVPQDQLLATVNGRSQLATLWRCCSGLTTRVMRAPRPCYLFPLEAAEGNRSNTYGCFKKYGH